MIELFSSPEAWISLATLAALEIVLGIDNIVFISILAGKLPEEQRSLARKLGLALALISRLALLASLKWVMSLQTPLFTAFGFEISGRDLILIVGGLFLITKATLEIYDKVEAARPDSNLVAAGAAAARMGPILLQIMFLDIVFSLDSVITAIGMVDDLRIMALAVVLAVIVMLVFANPVGDFVERRPTIKVLALAFLVMIGVLLVAEGTGTHFDKGYVYFAMAFSLTVEMLNLRFRAHQAPSDH